MIIRPKGIYATLSEPLPENVEYDLKNQFAWVNPLDLEHVEEFYGNRRMYAGVMSEVRNYLSEQHGIEATIDLTYGLTPRDFECSDSIVYRPLQEELVQAALQYRYGLLCAPPGVGKCLARGTEVIMFDGAIKVVEDVEVGDLLLGPDSQPRRVSSITSGVDSMYEITPLRYGDSFVCNSTHILSLMRSRSGTLSEPKGTIVNVPLNEYLTWSKYKKSNYKLYKAEQVTFKKSNSELPLPPYILGAWLGDGALHNPSFTTKDIEILNEFEKWVSQNNNRITKTSGASSGKAFVYNVRSNSSKHNTNVLREGLKKCGISVETGKFIPQTYKTSSIENRLELLAGIIDTDGYRHRKSLIEVVSKYKRLAYDIAFVVRSLGFACNVKETTKCCTNTGAVGTYWRVTFSGGSLISKIKTRLTYKQPEKPKINKTIGVSGFSVTFKNVSEYFGFTLDGPDRRFLLSDFTVTHNTVTLTKIISLLGKSAVVITEAVEPFYGAYETLSSMTDINVGLIGDGEYRIGDVNVLLVQTATRRAKEFDEDLFNVLNSAKVWITDEAHNSICDSYQQLFACAGNVEYFLGTTATPFPDSKEQVLYSWIGPILKEIKLSEAIDNKLLVPFTLYTQPTKPRKFGYTNKDAPKVSSVVRRKQYAKVYREFIIRSVDRNMQYVNFARACVDNGLTCAIIVSKTEHGNNIAKLIPEAVEVYGPTARKKRKKIWEDLQDRSIKVVITTLMDEATNIPSLDAVALAAGGKSKVKLVQRLRNLRTFSGETSEGFYTKERGFVFITKDNTDFLRSHSTLNVSYLTDLVSQHPDNTHEEISL